MINTINLIPNKIQIDKLKPYKKDMNIIKSLSHIGISLIENEEIQELEDNDTFICESDQILFSTSNNEEESFLQFHVYDKENDDFVIHHDVFVYSSINDAEYFYKNDKHFIALATFEKDVMVYDSCIFNPMAPQILLKGHEDHIMCVKKFGENLFSGSEDKSIIEWDIIKETFCNFYKLDLVPEKICKSNNHIFYTDGTTIKSSTSDLHFSCYDRIENLIACDNMIYVSNSTGDFFSFDLRASKSPYFSNKYVESALTGMDLLNNKIALCSKSGEIFILDLLDYELKNSEKIKSVLYSIKLHEDNLIFYGDESDTLHLKKLKNKVF